MYLDIYDSSRSGLYSICTFSSLYLNIVRKSKPCQKMIFTSYDSISESLEKICDSIDKYYKEK